MLGDIIVYSCCNIFPNPSKLDLKSTFCCGILPNRNLINLCDMSLSCGNFTAFPQVFLMSFSSREKADETGSYLD